nr:hypothetical protein [Tanacetum cinerariifolium]
ESAPAEEPMQTTQDLEEPSHQEFETGTTDDQPITKASQHPEWFQQQNKPPTLDRAWNKTLSATHESIQPWISDLAKQAESRSFFNELMDTPFYEFTVNRESARDVYLKHRCHRTSDWRMAQLQASGLDHSAKADKSDGQRMLCFQRLSKNVYKKHHHPTACERPSTSDGTLNDVRTALGDRLKGIRMKYLPQAI